MPNLVTATKLIGSVTVQPATVKPGEPVLVQVCDSNGRPYADNSGVTITINGVEATSRYYQFAAPGTINLTVRAVHGATSETSTATIQVTGEALAFRRTPLDEFTLTQPQADFAVEPGPVAPTPLRSGWARPRICCR